LDNKFPKGSQNPTPIPPTPNPFLDSSRPESIQNLKTPKFKSPAISNSKPIKYYIDDSLPAQRNFTVKVRSILKQ